MSFNRNISELKFWCQAVLPLVYDDSLSYYELLCKVVHKLNETIDLANKLNSEWNDIKGTALQLIIDYVNEQINNGTIGTMIEEATKEKFAELEKELNALGKTVTDNKSETDSSIESLKNTVSSNYSALSDKINVVNNSRKTFNFNGNTILIGDSYGDGYTPDGNVTSWCTLVKNYLNLGDKCYAVTRGGSGFKNGTTFNALLRETVGHFADKTTVKNIVVCGGYNDANYALNELILAIADFKDKAIELYPEANVFIGFCGFNTDFEIRGKLLNACDGYVSGCGYNGLTYLSGIENAIHSDAMVASDGLHPNTWGQETLAKSVTNALLCGYASVVHAETNAGIAMLNGFTDKGSAVITSQHDGVVSLSASISVSHAGFDYKMNGTDINIAKITGVYFTGGYHSEITVPVTLQNGGTYKTFPATIRVVNQVIELSFRYADGTDYTSFNIQSIQMPQFTINATTFM